MKIEYTHVVKDGNGRIVNASRNLRGVRNWASQNLAENVSIWCIANGKGKLAIDFSGGSYFETEFASFDVLRGALRNWRNLYGAALRVNGIYCGLVEYRNPSLR